MYYPGISCVILFIFIEIHYMKDTDIYMGGFKNPVC